MRIFGAAVCPKILILFYGSFFVLKKKIASIFIFLSSVYVLKLEGEDRKFSEKMSCGEISLNRQVINGTPHFKFDAFLK